MTEQNEGKDSLLALAILLYLAGHERTSVNPSRFRGLTQREAKAVSMLIVETEDGPLLNKQGIGIRRRLLGSAIIADKRSAITGLHYDEIPSPATVAERLMLIGGHAGAMRLKHSMTEEGWRVLHAELGIQRAIDDGAIVLGRDWSLSLAEN